jgi:hypothetical protein
MIDEILEHGQLLDRQVFELHPTAPDADLFPGAFRDFPIIYNSTLNFVHVNKKIIAAEYFYCGAVIIVLTYRQVPEAHSSHADILDLPSIDMFIWSYKSSERPFFAFEPFEFSLFLKYLSATVHYDPLLLTRMLFSLFGKA